MFIVDAMQGQDAVNTARAFREALPLTGVILTKLDGDARGGAALSVVSVAGQPVRLVGVGERIEDLEPFAVDGRLVGETTAVLAVRGVDEGKVKATATAAQTAGATVPGILWIEDKWNLADADAVKALQDALGVTIKNKAALRTEAWRQLGVRLATAPSEVGTDDLLAALVDAGAELILSGHIHQVGNILLRHLGETSFICYRPPVICLPRCNLLLPQIPRLLEFGAGREAVGGFILERVCLANRCLIIKTYKILLSLSSVANCLFQ